MSRLAVSAAHPSNVECWGALRLPQPTDTGLVLPPILRLHVVLLDQAEREQRLE